MATKKKPTEAAPVVADAAEEVMAAKVKAPGLRLKELVEKVAEQSSAPKKAVRETVEALLNEIGAALDRGEELNLPGFGRAKVVKTADKGGQSVLTLKLKRGGPGKVSGKAKEGVAEPGEDS